MKLTVEIEVPEGTTKRELVTALEDGMSWALSDEADPLSLDSKTYTLYEKIWRSLLLHLKHGD